MNFKDFLLQTTQSRPSEATPPAKETLNTLDNLSVKDIEFILDNFSAMAIQQMGIGRGLGLNGKKGRLVPELARSFYNEQSIKAALDRLSLPGQYGLARLKAAGGVKGRDAWHAQVTTRFGKEGADRAERELVGGALALYAQHQSGFLQFRTYSKHEIGKPGFYYGESALCSPTKILNLFKPGTPNIELLAPPAPKPYLGDAPKVATSANFEQLLADIFTFLRYLEQNKVKVLQSGELGKRDFVKLSEQMQVKDLVNPSEAKKLSEVGRVNFVWNILLYGSLLVINPDQSVSTRPDLIQQFYAAARFNQVRILTAGWALSAYNDFVRVPSLKFQTTSPNNSDIPDADHLRLARDMVMSVLQNFFDKGNLEGGTQGGWVDLASFATTIREIDLEFLISRSERPGEYYGYNNGYYGNEYYNGFTSDLKQIEKKKNGSYIPPKALLLDKDWDLVEGEWLAHLFREPFAWLGVAELGLNSATERGVALRLTDLGRAMFSGKLTAQEEEAARIGEQLAAQAPELARSLLVQPNFDVMVLAPLQNMPLLQQVDRFANQTSMGDVAMYHINKESVLRGMRSGLNGSEITKILQDNSRVPVAQNILTSLSDWNAEFERLILRPQALLLEVPNPAMLDKLLAEPKTAAYIEKRFGLTFALLKVRSETLDKALAGLAAGKAPVTLDYNKNQPGTITLEGEKRLIIKEKGGNPYLYYRLGQFADPVEYDNAKRSAVFELSAAAGQRAQTLDQTYQTVKAFLDGWRTPRTALPLPMNLALKGWLGYYGALKGERAVTLSAGTSAQLDDIFALEEFAPLLIERASPKVALVREELFFKLRPRLEELGLLVDAPGLVAPLSPPSVALSSASQETTALVVGNEAERKGRKLAETQAERERKQREAAEDFKFSNPARGANPFFLGRQPVLSQLMPDGFYDEAEDDDDDLEPPTQADLLELIQLMAKGGLLTGGDADKLPPSSFRRPPKNHD